MPITLILSTPLVSPILFGYLSPFSQQTEQMSRWAPA